MGRLDRTVFQRGGVDLQEECENIGHCEEGDVKLTGGYFLPAKHVLHAIPPMVWQESTEDVLHKMYGGILRMASVLKATSIAIPALGTGKCLQPSLTMTYAVSACHQQQYLVKSIGIVGYGWYMLDQLSVPMLLI